jgi:O-antigen ligase
MRRPQVPIILAAVSLFASVTNLIPASTLFFLLICLLPGLLRHGWPPSRLVVAAFWMMGCCIAWTVVYDPTALLNYNFWRRDGNLLITLLPLVLFGLWRLQADYETLVRRFLIWSGAINALLLSIYLCLSNLHTDEPLYVFLFVAHNAAGGYLATAAALCTGFWLATRDRWLLVALLSHLAGLLATNSRGSELGLLCALILHLICRERRIWWRIATAIAVLLCAGLIYWGMPVYQASGGCERRAAVSTDLEMERGHTVLIRLCYLWPKAADLWLASPLLGTGFGSYNDDPIELQGTPHLLSWNGGPTRIYSDGHAHNTYLHLLAETGLVGLCLLVWLILEMRRACWQLPSAPLRRALLLALATAIWSSWTEHRFFTPSQMLPLTIVLGLAAPQTRKMGSTA